MHLKYGIVHCGILGVIQIQTIQDIKCSENYFKIINFEVTVWYSYSFVF